MLSHSVVSNSLRSVGLQSSMLLCPWRFSKQEYWSWLPCPPPGDLPDPGIKPGSPAWQVDSLPPSKLVKVFLSLLSIESLNSPEWLLHWVINVEVFPYAMILCSIKSFGDTVFLKRVSFCNLLAWFLLFAVKSGPSDSLRSPVSYVAEFRFKPNHSDFRMTNWSLC